MRGRRAGYIMGTWMEAVRFVFACSWDRDAMMAKLEGTGDRFGDYYCGDCAYLICVSGDNQFTNTKFTRHNCQIWKTNDA